MQRFEHVVANQNGTFLPGASVTVTIANATPGTGAAASLFSDEGTTSLGTNVVVSDSNGRVVFYVADGKYDLTFTGVGITTYIRAALEIADMTGTTFAADVQGKFNTLAVSSNATVGGTLGVTGAVTAASVTATSGSPLGLLSGSTGTDLATAWGRTTSEANMGVVASTGHFFTNSDLAPGDFFLRLSSSTNRIYLGAGTAAAPLVISNTGIQAANVSQQAATTFIIKDNQGGTRFSIPSGGVAASTLNNTNVAGASTLTQISFLTGVSQGSGFKHQRFGATNATTAAAGANVTTAYTWTTPFADANYTMVVVGVTQANAPTISVESITASGFTVRVTAVTANAASYGGVDAIAFHD